MYSAVFALSGVKLPLMLDGDAHAGIVDALETRAGDLIAVARENAWFTYYYWLDDRRAPDFARCVDIHRKPGYDPVELFLDPKLRAPKLKVAGKLLKKKLGFRMLMDVVPLDASLVKGSHGVCPHDSADWPVLIGTGGGARQSRIAGQAQVVVGGEIDEDAPSPDHPGRVVRMRDKTPAKAVEALPAFLVEFIGPEASHGCLRRTAAGGKYRGAHIFPWPPFTPHSRQSPPFAPYPFDQKYAADHRQQKAAEDRLQSERGHDSQLAGASPEG